MINNKNRNFNRRLNKSVKIIKGDFKDESGIILAVNSKYIVPVYTIELFSPPYYVIDVLESEIEYLD